MTPELADISAILNTTPERWTRLTTSLADELLRRQPIPGEWSALECLQHLVDVEKVFQSRLQAFLAGQDFPAFDPDSEGTRLDGQVTPAALADRFALLRRRSLDALRQIEPADLERRVRHAELGPVTLGEMLHEWAAHDLNHTIQAEQALAQPFIRGCGPWQRYFAGLKMVANAR